MDGKKLDVIPLQVIPRGDYCYTPICFDKASKMLQIDVCPFWSTRKGKRYQENGYCDYLKQGDWETGGLLWDQVKECNINTEEE